MNLTRRQREFLAATAELQDEMADQLVHYALVADRLDVSPMTAYNMLRLLLKKGCVSAHYHLPEKAKRSGRSSLVYRLTAVGWQVLRNIDY